MKQKKKLASTHERCPYPNCDHIGLIITKVHCRTHHNMEREELFKKYGYPEPIEYDQLKAKLNKSMMDSHYL